MPSWQLVSVLLGSLLYGLLSHGLMLHAADQPWAVAALLGPLVFIVGALAWRSRHWAAIGGLALACAALAALVAEGGAPSAERLYVLQHVGIHLALGASFGFTLKGPGLSAIGRLAQRVHRLTPEMVAYTRRVTVVWTAYFFAMAGASIGLYLAGPWAAWSLLANLGTPLGIGALFVGEHLLRYRLHPEFERVTLAAALRACSGTVNR